MEVYRRITEQVRGALWAHHRRLMPERQFHRILAYVYNNKYEYQIRLDQMEVVGTEWGGRVEVVTTPAGFMKQVRVHPAVEQLPQRERYQLVLSAYGKAVLEGHKVMQAAENKVYGQFLQDLKPIVMGIRDNPEFFTVEDGAIETLGGVLHSPVEHPKGTTPVARTIPVGRAHQPHHEYLSRQKLQEQWLQSNAGKRWAKSLQGKNYLQHYSPESRLPGAPGAKRRVAPFELLAPYTPMDETRLRKKNWMAYLDNKHVAESLWTRAKVGERERRLRRLQEKGQAWHHPINPEATERW